MFRNLMTSTAPFLMSPADGSNAGGGSPSGPAGGSTSSSSAGSSSGGSTPGSTGGSTSGASPPGATPGVEGSQPGSAGGEQPGGEASFDLGSIFGDDIEASPSMASPPPAQQQPPAEKQQPGQQPPGQQQQPTDPARQQQPQQQPGAQTRPEGASEASAPVLDPLDPNSILGAINTQEGEAAMVKALSEGVFSLSKEDAEALESDTIGTIPRLLARVFIASQRNMLTHLSKMGPAMVTRGIEAARRNSTNEAKFFKAWPGLKQSDPTHLSTVRQYAAVYRNMNPNATLDQAIADVGPMVMMALKVAPGAAPAQQRGNGTVVHQQQPFVPAQSGAAVITNEGGGGEYDFLNPEIVEGA